MCGHTVLPVLAKHTTLQSPSPDGKGWKMVNNVWDQAIHASSVDDLQVSGRRVEGVCNLQPGHGQHPRNAQVEGGLEPKPVAAGGPLQAWHYWYCRTETVSPLWEGLRHGHNRLEGHAGNCQKRELAYTNQGGDGGEKEIL